jgi:hypothetical protein
VTTTPLSLHAVEASPVLDYHTARPAPTGLHVERTAEGLVIALYPPSLRAEVKRACRVAPFVAAVFTLFFGVLLLVDEPMSSPGGEVLRFIIIAACALPSGAVDALLVFLFLRATVRIDVLPETLAVTVTGLRLYYRDEWPRADVVDVQRRFHGVRIQRHARVEWIAFGTKAQQLEIRRLLREELKLS